MKNNVWNISSSLGFADTLVKHFLAEYADDLSALSEVMFLLPNRRAVRAMKEAFVRERGLTPMLLPRMIPLGEVEEDELFLTGGNGREMLAGMYPAIGVTERLLLFVRIIMAKPTDFGMKKMSLSQACYLAQELSTLIDTVKNQHLSFENLKNLVADDYASHWQETLRFLEIITNHWPNILESRKLIDASERRDKLLQIQSEIWKINNPRQRIVIAGTTAAFPAMKELVKTVLGLPNGELYLAGLDKFLGDDDWAEINESHPQYELKELIDFLKLERKDILDLVPAYNSEVEAFVSEIMRPAKVSDKWLNLAYKTFGPQAWGGIELINCADVREEALTIALIMRKVLDDDGKTAALVTSDRNLARRVACELERWNIVVDDSAGKPLSLMPVGIFLRQVLQAAGSKQKTDWLSLIKNPMLCMGRDYGEVRNLGRRLDKIVWRQQGTDDEALVWENELRKVLQPLTELLDISEVDFKDLIEQHIKVAEKLATRTDKSGAQVLWGGDDGEAAARFVADLYEYAAVLGKINPKEYEGLLQALMMGINVRARYGMHPRLKILGPIEARLNRFDVTIIGEVNEGIWPQACSADPWMSRPMKKEFGFPLPERAIGVTAFDFAQLLCGDEVYLTRADRVQGTPMVKSRWWLRLETVLKALKIKPESIENDVYRLWAKQLDKPQEFETPVPPAPKPPLKYRPQELSASAIELWVKDPYSVFAKYILKLYALDNPDKEPDNADYGNIVHAVLQQFNNQYSGQLPDNARDELIRLGQEAFSKDNIAAEIRAVWWPKFIKSVDWILQQEKEYRLAVKKVYNEVKGKIQIETPRGFAITAKADRVDMLNSGGVNVIDYKTGSAKKESEVRAGYAPQLPVEALIAQAGGFDNVPQKVVEKLIYWQLNKKETVIEKDMEKLLVDTYRQIQRMANLFEFESTAYLSCPNPAKAPKYSDYEHLARVREWSVVVEDEGFGNE